MCFIYVTIDIISLMMMVLKYVRSVSSAFLKTHTIVRITHLLHTYWHCVLVVQSGAESFQNFLNGTNRDSCWNILLLESKWKTRVFMASITITSYVLHSQSVIVHIATYHKIPHFLHYILIKIACWKRINGIFYLCCEYIV